MTFGEKIRNLRQKCILSQEAFAKELGVSFSTVNRWETDKCVPNYITMKKIKDYFDSKGIEFDLEDGSWKENNNIMLPKVSRKEKTYEHHYRKRPYHI